MKHMDKFGILADCSSEKENKKLSSNEAPNVNGVSGMVDEVQFTETYVFAGVKSRRGFMTEARRRWK